MASIKSIMHLLLVVVALCSFSANVSADTYDDLTLCVQLCTDATEDAQLMAMLYNDGNKVTYRQCVIDINSGMKEGDQACCTDGGQPTSYSKKVNGDYTAFVIGAVSAQTAPSNQCIGQLIIKNGNNNVQQLKSFIHHNTNKCGLTHKSDTCGVVSPKHNFQTGEYSHIHIGSDGVCMMAGATLSNPVSDYCSGVHVYDCQQALCNSTSRKLRGVFNFLD